MRRYHLCIFVLRESVSSFTKALTIENERHDCLKNALITLCADSQPLGNNPITVRVDPAPGFTTLVNDPQLKQVGIQLKVGRVKNINTNHVAEHAIEELGAELLHHLPTGGPFSQVTIALATANLNTRISSPTESQMSTKLITLNFNTIDMFTHN